MITTTINDASATYYYATTVAEVVEILSKPHDGYHFESVSTHWSYLRGDGYCVTFRKETEPCQP
jgi:hypothetical protein